LTITFTGGKDVTNTFLINWLYANEKEKIDLSVFQTKIDETLETESKEIVGAINELNAKIGISTPSVSLIGTWTVIDEPEIPTTEMLLSFTSNGETFNSIDFSYTGSSSWNIRTLTYGRANGDYVGVYTDNPSGNYGIPHGWSDEAYKTITVTEEPTDANAIAWLGANTDAPKVELPKEKMPQIRFAGMPCDGWFGRVNWEELGIGEGIETLNIKFTIEIVSGTVQPGDALQLCGMKWFGAWMSKDGSRSHPKKKKLRRFAEHTISEEDVGKRFITMTISGENKKALRLFTHSEYNGGHISPIYFRIRRPKGEMNAGDGGGEMTIDADFSNVVTVWKSYFYCHWFGEGENQTFCQIRLI
jgi:hypothetical protein